MNYLKAANAANTYINGLLKYDNSVAGASAQELYKNQANPDAKLSDYMNSARCFNYVQEKAKTLLSSGVPREQLRVMQGLYNGVPHSVLMVDDGTGDPLILGNNETAVKRLSERPELKGFEQLPLSDKIQPDWVNPNPEQTFSSR